MVRDALHSLRGRLLLLLFGAVLVTACVQAYVAYRTSLNETNEIFDYQMEQIAISLRSGLPVDVLPSKGFRESKDESFEFIVQVSTSDEKYIFRSSTSITLPRSAKAGLSTFDARGTTYKLFSLYSGTRLIQVAQDRAARRDLARKLALKTVMPIFIMMALLLFLVWVVVNASLAPVDQVRKQVASRHADDLHELRENGLPDEIFPLVHELNLLFHRVRKAFEAQKNFIADAAHELRSPLSALKLQVEGLRRAPDDQAREAAFQRLSSGIDRSTRLVEQLLSLARHQATAGEANLTTSVELKQLLQTVIGEAWESANGRHIDIGLADADECTVLGNFDALKILFRNLLDNTIKYSTVGGIVNVAINTDENSVLVSIEDSGHGIPSGEIERVFDRFYRATGTKESGSGLGLAIVKAIADMHSAKIAMSRSLALGGLRVVVEFPAVSNSK